MNVSRIEGFLNLMCTPVCSIIFIPYKHKIDDVYASLHVYFNIEDDGKLKKYPGIELDQHPFLSIHLRNVPVVASNNSIRQMIAIWYLMVNKDIITFKIDLWSSSNSKYISRSSDDVTSSYLCK